MEGNTGGARRAGVSMAPGHALTFGMDLSIVLGVMMAVAVAALVWPAVRRAGTGALPVLLFWAAAIALVTFIALLVQRWQAAVPSTLPPTLPSQRGVEV